MKSTEPLRLNDIELAVQFHALREEVARRTKAATADSATIIRGHEMAKRAIVVAAAGGHSLFLFGGPFGKTMLRALALELGVKHSWEARPCPCGFIGDSATNCKCSLPEIRRHRKKHFVAADISVEVCRVPEQEMAGKWPGTTLENMRKQVEQAGPLPTEAIDELGQTLLKHAVTELGLSPEQRETVLSVAATIARLDNVQSIRAAHLCEAVNYRTPKEL